MDMKGGEGNNVRDESPPSELGQSLGDRLGKSLKYAGMSQAEMAEFLEVHRNTISGYVSGRTKMLPAIMRLWAAKTNVPLEWLRDGVWPKADQPAKKQVKAAPAAKKAAARARR